MGQIHLILLPTEVAYNSFGTTLTLKVQLKMGRRRIHNQVRQAWKYFVNLTVTDDDGRSSTASVLVEVKEKPSEGLFGMTTSTAVGAALGVIIVLLVVVLLLRGRDLIPFLRDQRNVGHYVG